MKVIDVDPKYVEVFNALTGRHWGFGVETEDGAQVLRLNTVAPDSDAPPGEMQEALGVALAEAQRLKMVDE